MAVFQAMQARVSSLNARLRDWKPERHGEDLALTIGNRYLTPAKEAGDDPEADLAEVDPFNVFRPLIRNEVHTADNVVEYWQRLRSESGWVS